MSESMELFAARLLAVIDEGRRVATYKLALLLALLDATAEQVGPSGEAPTELTSMTIADHVIRLYFPQVRLFLAADGRELELRQITAPRSTTVAAVLRLRVLADAHRLRSIAAVRAALPDDYANARRTVETNFWREPIPRLQRVGADDRPFIYEIVPGPRERRRIRFLVGASDQLLRLAPLLRPLIELHWTRMVAGLTQLDLEEDRLRGHLFGVDRQHFPARLRDGLRELQDRECFYCGDRLPPRCQVDHFIPWARWPNDAVENLVLADRCNGDKSDSLAAAEHVERWQRRLSSDRDLHALALDCGWTSEHARSQALARTAYAHVPAGAPLWLRRREFETADPHVLLPLLR